ncbi:MAG: hypothetical protein WAV47_11260 [Blastocatellia bacterium]
MLRIVLIGTYLRKTKRKLGQPDYLELKDYETFVADILGKARDNPFSLFGLELAAIHGSTLVFSIIILTYGFVLASSNSSLAYLYLVSGFIGIIFTTLLFATFGKRVRRIMATPIERKVTLRGHRARSIDGDDFTGLAAPGRGEASSE